MSVAIRIFKYGKEVSEIIYEGYPIEPFNEYLEKNNLDSLVDNARRAAVMMSTNLGKVMVTIDDKTVVEGEPIPLRPTEYAILYDEKIYNELKSILEKEKV